ncbi:hypothetical protein [Mycobacterium cookii]|nr:hypothetical protein [Mycobacterium cookii]
MTPKRPRLNLLSGPAEYRARLIGAEELERNLGHYLGVASQQS